MLAEHKALLDIENRRQDVTAVCAFLVQMTHLFWLWCRHQELLLLLYSDWAEGVKMRQFTDGARKGIRRKDKEGELGESPGLALWRKV